MGETSIERVIIWANDTWKVITSDSDFKISCL